MVGLTVLWRSRVCSPAAMLAWLPVAAPAALAVAAWCAVTDCAEAAVGCPSPHRLRRVMAALAGDDRLGRVVYCSIVRSLMALPGTGACAS
jgi:hypothetical protein